MKRRKQKRRRGEEESESIEQGPRSSLSGDGRLGGDPKGMLDGKKGNMDQKSRKVGGVGPTQEPYKVLVLKCLFRRHTKIGDSPTACDHNTGRGGEGGGGPCPKG